jgi:hypothetical protein
MFRPLQRKFNTLVDLIYFDMYLTKSQLFKLTIVLSQG